jgi:hypothetical protein
MTKKEIIDLTGEDPEDMFGSDWANEIEDLVEADFFCPVNNCGNAKDPEDATCGDASSH